MRACPLGILLAALNFVRTKLGGAYTTDCVGLKPVRATLSCHFFAGGCMYGTIKSAHVLTVLRKMSVLGAATAAVSGSEDSGSDSDSDDDNGGTASDGDTLAWLLYVADAEMLRCRQMWALRHECPWCLRPARGSHLPPRT
jgi:hypothetical protein